MLKAGINFEKIYEKLSGKVFFYFGETWGSEGFEKYSFPDFWSIANPKKYSVWILSDTSNMATFFSKAVQHYV